MKDKGINQPIFKVGRTTSETKKEEIYRFRYEVYIEELGKTLSSANKTKRWIKDELDETAILFFVEVEGKIIATSRMNYGGATHFSEYWRNIYKLDEFSDYAKESISLSSRIMVAKEWRGSLALGNLIFEIFSYARSLGVKFDFCHCSPSLVEFYEHLGYRRYVDGFMSNERGYLLPLVLVTQDIEHFRQVRSPFLRLTKKLNDNSNETRVWFEKHFLKQKEYINRRLYSTQEFWNVLEEKISKIPSKNISLFEGLDELQIQKFIGMSTLIKVQENRVVLRQGDVGDEMFVVLSGIIEVKSSLEKDGLSLAILEAGQIFGEMAFVSHAPRNASVISLTDSELLVLTQNFFNKAIKHSPEITAKVLFNLANILASRLQVCTQNWVDSTNTL